MKAKLRTLGQKLKPSGAVKLRPSAKKVDSFYTSPEWRALMDSIIRARGRRCEDVEHDTATPRTGVRIFGDHIVERRDGGAPLDPANVLLRCGSCHTRKTAEMRRHRYQAG